MSENKELRFVRLRSHEDLIGYVSIHEEHIVIERPLRVEVDTYMEEYKQLMSLQEYLPQAIVSIQEVEIPYYDVLFTAPVKPDFVEQYQQISEFFYDLQNRTKSKKESKETVTETAKKVVSILEAMASKKDKPVH